MTTLAPERELTELEARSIAAKYGDLRTYSRAVHGHDVEDYQLAWYEALETENRLAIICPPDTYKSTTVQHWAEQAIGRTPERRILWLMGTKEQAQKRIIAIKQTIEQNPVYQRAFGIEPNLAAKWTNTELFVKRHRVSPDPTLMATGFLGAYQGLHFDDIIIDDPTDMDDVRSPSIMEAQRSRLRGVLSDRLVEGGSIKTIFTRWSEADLLPTFREMGFRVVQMPIMAKYPWGPTISPRRFPEERIAAMRKEKGDVLFNLTYMCDTSALEGQLIKREHLRYWDESMIPTTQMPVFMAVDPAASTRTTADRSAIATVGYDIKSRRVYLLDLWQGRVEVPDLREEIVKRAKRVYGLVALGLETAGFQLSLVQDIKRQHQLPIREIPYRSRRQVQSRALGIDKDKTSRALYLSQLFTSGRLFLPKGLPTYDGTSLETELLSFGSPTNPHHDDGPDAVAFAVALAEASVPSQPQIEYKIGW